MVQEYTFIDKVGEPFGGRLTEIDTHTEYNGERDGFATERIWIPESVDILNKSAVDEYIHRELKKNGAVFEY